MKTLANCTLEEFLPQAYKTREVFHALYHAVDMDGLRKNFAAKYRDAEKAEQDAVSRNYIAGILRALMLENAAMTVDVIAALSFLTREEANKLKPREALEILTECITDESVMSFFINAERLASEGTDGIYLMLIWVWQSVSGVLTSQNASTNSASGTTVNSSSEATSENV